MKTLCLLLVSLVCVGCNSAIPSETVRPVRRQVIAPSANHHWRLRHAGMCCCLPDAEGYDLWYTGNDGSGYSICHAKLDRSFAIVSDGPCLPRTAGTFDEAGVFMPCVVRREGMLWMYYAAHSGGTFPGPGSSTGLAISLDNGATWKKMCQTLTAEGDDRFGVGTHFVWNDDSGWKWRMIYTHVEGVRPHMRYFMKFAVSDNGVQWIRPENNIALDYDDGTSARPFVWKTGGRYLMAYTHNAKQGRGPETYRIRLAESKDGLRFHDRGQFLDVSNSGWDSQMVCYPWLIPDRGLLFYTGNNFGAGGIGVTELFVEE